MSEIDNNRLLRYREAIAGFDYTLEHVSGKKNCMADCLSRDPRYAGCQDPGETVEVDTCQRLGSTLEGAARADPLLRPMFEAAKEEGTDS